LLAVGVVPATSAVAATTVSGERDTNAPLEIGPDTEPQIRTVGPGGPSSDYLAYLEPLVTKRVASVTLGDLARGGGCSVDAEVHLFIYEYDSDHGSPDQIASSVSRQRLGADPARVTWAIPPTTLKKGSAYSIGIGAPATACGQYRQRTWAHNFSVVNGGPSKCTYLPSSLRMWHEQGQDDRLSPCVTRTTDPYWSPSMPTGWLDIWVGSYNYPNFATNWSQPPPAANACSSPTAEVAFWRPSPGTSNLSDYVCRWPRFAPYGETVSHGWYYALPWSRDAAAPRDSYLRLDTIDYDSLLRTYAPVLKFDSQGDYWNASPRTMTDWHENRLDYSDPGVPSLCGGDGAFEHPDGGVGWGLETLVVPPSTYPGTDCAPEDTDQIDAGGDDKEAADSYLYGSLDNQGHTRAVHDSAGALWLQYWFFYYYNTQSFLGFGAHQGDWEMVQYRLGAGDIPDVATYAQHKEAEGEGCRWDQVERYPIVEGGSTVREAPVVYVAAASQASYFVAGNHVRNERPDDSANGQGAVRNPEPKIVSLAGPPAWAAWPGQWGEDSGSPRGPALQGSKWSDPQAFHDAVGGCSNPDGSLR